MENQNNNTQNGGVQPSQGTIVPKGHPNGEKQKVKEGNPKQQRPKYGSDGGPNTSTRENQLPSLNDGGKTGSASNG